jgi:hypothetical protein
VELPNTKGEYQAAIEPLRAALMDLIELNRLNRTELDDRPAEGSPAYFDEKLETGYVHLKGRPALEPLLLGRLQLVAAEDLIAAFCSLVALPPAVLFADRVLTRSAIEACARSRWLLDPIIDPRTRVARGVTERLFGLHADTRYLGVEEANKKRDRMKELARQADLDGFTILWPKKEAPCVAGCRRPTAGQAMTQILGDDYVEGVRLGPSTQGYLSMFVHATTSGLLSVGDFDLATPRAPGISNVPLVSSSSDVNSFFGLCALAYINAATAHRQLLGWTDDRWRKVCMNFAALNRRFNGN